LKGWGEDGRSWKVEPAQMSYQAERPSIRERMREQPGGKLGKG